MQFTRQDTTIILALFIIGLGAWLMLGSYPLMVVAVAGIVVTLVTVILRGRRDAVGPR